MNRRDSLEYNLRFAKKKPKSKYTTLVLLASTKIHGFRISIELKRGSGSYFAIFFTTDFPVLSDIQNVSMKPPHGF